VKFVGEQGVDQGGVRKEFFILVIRQIFDPNYGMFNYNEKTRLYWFNHFSFEPKIKYELIGTIFGLAIYNNTILDVKLPISVYKKLLGIKLTFEDLKECDNELYKNLEYILNQDNPKLEEELDTNFTVVDDKFGEKIVVPLKPGGENIMINNFNKSEYVELYVDWYFNKSIDEYFKAFEKGFYKVFNRNLTKILTPQELELIICGTQVLDFHELKHACVYEEFEKDSETIKYFWEILFDFNEEEKKKFLSFVTGCDRAPIDGLGSLPITVTNGGSDLNQLPTAHTCFNNLILPDYKNKEKLKKALLTAINYSEGFGLI
jgi:ubiquitin-protein ligase E3 A